MSQKVWRKFGSAFVGLMCLSGCGGSPQVKSNPPSSEDLLAGIVTAQAPDTPESLAEKKLKLQAKLDSAKELMAKGELDPAIANLEEAVAFDPKHREVLMLLVKTSQQRSKEVTKEDPWKSYRLIVQAGGYLRTLREIHPDLSPEEQQLFAGVLFDEACSHAKSKRYDEFRGSLSAALGAGFKDAERLRSDSDIKPLWDVPEMKEVLDQAVASLQK